MADTTDVYRQLIELALPLWPDTDGAAISLINVSENMTYRVDAVSGARYVVRLHRQNNNIAAIESELAWVSALQTDGVLQTPCVINGINKRVIQCIKRTANKILFDQLDVNLVKQRLDEVYLVMFAFIEGREPDDTDDVLLHFELLGEMAARAHNHSAQWVPPLGFARGSWNTDTLLNSTAVWGQWQRAPGLNDTMLPTLNKVCDTVTQRLCRLGQDKAVYGLIHADMRRANLLVNKNDIRLIDFDDCGFGWYLYDFASAVSFIENHPRLLEFKMAWLLGYRRWRQPTRLEVQEIDTLIMLRRLALMAWMGGHPEVPIVQQLQDSFAKDSCQLAEGYLATH